MADIQVTNTDADLSDNTLLTEENAYTITGLHTFSRSTNAPFACVSGAAVVAYLDADKLDGIEATGFVKANGTVALTANWDAGAYEIRAQTLEADVSTGTAPLTIASTTKVANLNADKLDDQEGSYYLAAGNATGTLAVNRGGTGAATLTDGGVLLGSGTAAITATAVLGDGEILIGDASGDPTTLDVGSSTAITVLGTVATGVWQGDEVGVAYGGTGVNTLTDGGVLLGSGSSAITAMAVLTDGQMIVGDGTGDPVAESGATLRTSVGVGTGDSPQFTGLTISGTGASSLDVGGGINVGTGNVNLVGTDGKINGPLSSVIIDDLSGEHLTTLAAGNISSGTVATARLGSGTASSGTFLRGDSSWAAAKANSTPYITAAVGSDALTLSVVSAAAAAPSSGAPVDVIFRNVTPATGSPTTIALTGATTLVIPSGATMGASDGVAFRLWVCAFNDAGTVRLAALNCAGASSIYALGGWGISTSATIGTGSDANTTFYGSAGVTNKAFTVLGYVTYESGLSTAGTYDAVPTRVQTFGPGVALPGSSLRRIAATYATAVSSSSSTLADTGLTATLTPSSAANGVQVSVSMGQIQKHTGNTGLTTKLLRDSTILATPAITNLTNALTAQQSGSGPSVSYLDLPKVASALVYKMQFSSQANIAAVIVQLNNTTSSILLEEVQG